MAIYSPPPGSWVQELARRAMHLWWLKSAGTALFMVLFFYSYFEILRYPVYPVTEMPTTRIDDWVSFSPSGFYVYVSLWLYTLLVPALQPTAVRFFAYGCSIGALCATGLVCFLFFPTAVPFGSMPWFNDPTLATLRRLDLAGNACPSLHVATAIFTAACLHRILQATGSPRWLQLLSWVWCLLVVYSTMAIKQHVFWDVVAGSGLALIFVWFHPHFEKTLVES